VAGGPAPHFVAALARVPAVHDGEVPLDEAVRGALGVVPGDEVGLIAL
jgi:hypothetical protein